MDGVALHVAPARVVVWMMGSTVVSGWMDIVPPVAFLQDLASYLLLKRCCCGTATAQSIAKRICHPGKVIIEALLRGG